MFVFCLFIIIFLGMFVIFFKCSEFQHLASLLVISPVPFLNFEMAKTNPYTLFCCFLNMNFESFGDINLCGMWTSKYVDIISKFNLNWFIINLSRILFTSYDVLLNGPNCRIMSLLKYILLFWSKFNNFTFLAFRFWNL